LLNVADRELFAGNAVEKQVAPPRMMMPISKPEEDQAARSALITKMNGRLFRPCLSGFERAVVQHPQGPGGMAGHPSEDKRSDKYQA
jgi:hypothetical protein